MDLDPLRQTVALVLLALFSGAGLGIGGGVEMGAKKKKKKAPPAASLFRTAMPADELFTYPCSFAHTSGTLRVLLTPLELLC